MSAGEVGCPTVAKPPFYHGAFKLQYPGQEETEKYVVASVLLDGSDSTIGQQRIEGVPHNEVRSGMRVKAEWIPEAERTDDGLAC